MAPKLPLPRGWKRRVRSSFFSDMILSLLDSTTNMPFLARPESLNQYTRTARILLPVAAAPCARFLHLVQQVVIRSDRFVHLPDHLVTPWIRPL